MESRSETSENEQLDGLREACRNDLQFLVTEVMGLPRWSPGLHDDLVKVLEGAGDRKLVLLPRGHQKSTIICVAWVIQQLLRNPNLRVTIVSATWKLSKDLLHQIKGVLETSLLPSLFGSFVTTQSRWTTEYIDIAQRTKSQKDPTISTAGIDTGKTGSHCDLLIFDDIVSPENVTTPDQMRKVVAGYQDSLPLLDPGGRIVVIGTRYAIGDLYGQLIETEARTINLQPLATEEDRKNWRQFITT